MDVWISIVISVISGIVTGIITGILTYCLIRCGKPKIEIINTIAKSTEDEKDIYYIKVINKSKCYLYNLQYELCLINIKQGTNSKGERDEIKIRKVLKFAKPLWNTICPFSKDNTDYALWISTYNDLRALLKQFGQGAYISFTISANHGFSDSCKVFNKEFGYDQIKDGEFVCGDSGNICSIITN